MDITEQPPTILSLCTGYGGIERGIERVLGKITTLAHVEIESFAVANLVAKMEEGKMAPAPIWTDVKTFPVSPFREKVDILTGGYPCQPFSISGKRLGDKDPRHLWPHILRIIDEVMPRMCFFENVEGHMSKGLQEVLTDLESRGYQAEAGIFSAEEVGAPHRRKRIFIMAYDNDALREQQGRSCRKSGENTQELGVCSSRLYDVNKTMAYSKSSRGGRGLRELCPENEKVERSEERGKKKSTELDNASEDELDDTQYHGLLRLKKSKSTRSRVHPSEGQKKPEQFERSSSRESGFQNMANTNSTREPQQPQVKRESGDWFINRCQELANTSRERSQGWLPGWEDSKREDFNGRLGCSSAGIFRGWPSRPGETPKNWEAPKTVESRLRGATNGTSTRVDRLRMLGNGVVPQTAERAFRCLLERFKQE